MFDQDLYRTLARNLPGFGILLFDHTLRYVMALGDDILASVGLTADEIVGKGLDETGFPGRPDELERWYRDALDGAVSDVEVVREGRTFAVRIAPVRTASGHVATGIVTVHDITEMARAREALRTMSLTDELTGIYNRRGFLLLATQQLKVESRGKMGALLFFIDLNEMKTINDEIGHDAGDEALKATAAALASTFRESDIVARYGGDEFVVFMPDVIRSMEPVFRNRLQLAVADFNKRQQRFHLSMSVGSAYYDPDMPKDLDDLLAEADQGMYVSKRQRRAAGGSGEWAAAGRKLTV